MTDYLFAFLFAPLSGIFVAAFLMWWTRHDGAEERRSQDSSAVAKPHRCET